VRDIGFARSIICFPQFAHAPAKQVGTDPDETAKFYRRAKTRLL
jgi:hypothetical protein